MPQRLPKIKLLIFPLHLFHAEADCNELAGLLRQHRTVGIGDNAAEDMEILFVAVVVSNKGPVFGDGLIESLAAAAYHR